MLKNSSTSYGLVTKLLHWLTAVTVIALFALGLWMMELSYYDDWYVEAPHYHVSFGILLFVVMLLRVFWRLTNIQPQAPDSHSRFEKLAAHWTHIVIYVVIFCILITGYLIPTADNRGIDVFNWFTLPSMGAFIERQEDLAGELHEWLAYGLMAIVAIHALAALKHHFFDKDNTLKRMLYNRPTNGDSQ